MSVQGVEAGRPTAALFFIQLVTDADLLLPIVAAARQGANLLRAQVAVDGSLLDKFPRLAAALAERADAFVRIETADLLAGTAPDLTGFDAVVTATESSVNPHKAARALVRRARDAGLRTYTFQHGFENIGLNWFDEVHPASAIDFLSERILVWGPLARLPAAVRPETRAKCAPIGCTKRVDPPRGLLRKPPERPCFIAVFENLHWHRFSADYRDRFLADLEQAARALPDTTFFIRPHPAGRWLTARFKGVRPQAPNLLIADPADPEWDDWVGGEVFALADGVVTTPSTVALDAARAGKAVAVTAYGQDLSPYAPLPTFESATDWLDFARRCRTVAGRPALEELSAAFVAGALIPGDAAARVVALIHADVTADLEQARSYGLWPRVARLVRAAAARLSRSPPGAGTPPARRSTGR